MTITQVLIRGHVVLTLPSAMLMFGIPTAVWFTLQTHVTTGILWLGTFLGLFVGIVLGWLYLAVAKVRWGIWAFSNVENIHELERKVVRHFYSRGYKSAHWIIATRKEKRQLAKIRARLKAPEDPRQISAEDFQVPTQTTIPYSAFAGLESLLLSLLIVGIGIIMQLWARRNLAHMIAITSGMVLLIWAGYKWSRNRNPKLQIIIDDTGIWLPGREFHAWERIQNEHVLIRGFGRSRRYYLFYEYLTKSRTRVVSSCKVFISDHYSTHYTISIKELEHLLKVYRSRHNAQHSIQ